MVKNNVLDRSKGRCELCGSSEAVIVYEVPPQINTGDAFSMAVCENCLSQIEKRSEADIAHWQKLLPTAMWSEVTAVQVVAWRMLNRFKNESWAQDNLDLMYFDDETLSWAKALGDEDAGSSVDLHRDVNGNTLNDGDSVVLTKTLNVKGSTISAKLGTIVRNIRLVPDNTEQIEGRVEGQLIVILTKYVKKQ